MGDSTTSTPILFNSTGKDVYVLVKGKPRLLPTAPEPHVVGHRADEGTMEIEVLGKKGKKSIASLRLEGEEEATAIINDLPRAEGILYLVEPSTLLAFPDRDDFVAPASYVFAAEQFQKSKRRMRSRKSGLTDRDLARMLPLASVTRRAPAVVDDNTPVLALD